ncbi:hypothetical protein NE237_031490 [Protea cynaroides]|uniref:Neprosin activation peptide domain-containing protein n=1 Tax=Protea cynaroides TaxID=273540 RepID=A0A9Q0R276_9MAGN|nr:hypothetical protein NE237_031490 [Protea cynaroides]
MVGLMDSKVGIIFVILMIYIFVLVIQSGGGVRSLSRKLEEEDLELEKQLKPLNKPPLKSIKTNYRDIYDCVDIKKQPAFDHPVLRRNTIQMKPSSLPKRMMDKELLESKRSKIGVKKSWCPPGTVLMRRTQKEDIKRAKSQVRRYPGDTHQPMAIQSANYDSRSENRWHAMHLHGKYENAGYKPSSLFTTFKRLRKHDSSWWGGL